MKGLNAMYEVEARMQDGTVKQYSGSLLACVMWADQQNLMTDGKCEISIVRKGEDADGEHT